MFYPHMEFSRSKSKKPKKNKFDDLTKYDKFNLPLRAWSNANQSIRESRGLFNLADRYYKEYKRTRNG
jgi:hypothetical protein